MKMKKCQSYNLNKENGLNSVMLISFDSSSTKAAEHSGLAEYKAKPLSAHQPSKAFLLDYCNRFSCLQNFQGKKYSENLDHDKLIN